MIGGLKEKWHGMVEEQQLNYLTGNPGASIPDEVRMISKWTCNQAAQVKPVSWHQRKNNPVVGVRPCAR